MQFWRKLDNIKIVMSYGNKVLGGLQPRPLTYLAKPMSNLPVPRPHSRDIGLDFTIGGGQGHTNRNPILTTFKI